MTHNVFVYSLLRGLARNLANKNRTENPRACLPQAGVFVSKLELAINYIRCYPTLLFR